MRELDKAQSSPLDEVSKYDSDLRGAVSLTKDRYRHNESQINKQKLYDLVSFFLPGHVVSYQFSTYLEITKIRTRGIKEADG